MALRPHRAAINVRHAEAAPRSTRLLVHRAGVGEGYPIRTLPASRAPALASRGWSYRSSGKEGEGSCVASCRTEGGEQRCRARRGAVSLLLREYSRSRTPRPTDRRGTQTTARAALSDRTAAPDKSYRAERKASWLMV